MAAVVFDVDGTLVDTNWFHALAWWRVFHKAGEFVPMSRIHPLIGMGSNELLRTLFGDPRPDLKDGHTHEFEAFRDEIQAFPGAAELLQTVHDRGAQVVLATSSKGGHLKLLLEAIDADDAIDEIVHADEVEHGKPEPDVFATALEKLCIYASDTIAVGDSRWDIEAAGKIGIDTVSVLTGGTTRRDLAEFGAVAVYEDVADLLAHLDESPVGKRISAMR